MARNENGDWLDDGNLLRHAKRLKQTDGEGWAIGEMVERVVAASTDLPVRPWWAQRGWRFWRRKPEAYRVRPRYDGPVSETVVQRVEVEEAQ